MEFLCKTEVKSDRVYSFIKDKWYYGYPNGMLYYVRNESGKYERITKGFMDIIFELDPVKIREYKINKIVK